MILSKTEAQGSKGTSFQGAKGRAAPRGWGSQCEGGTGHWAGLRGALHGPGRVKLWSPLAASLK